MQKFIRSIELLLIIVLMILSVLVFNRISQITALSNHEGGEVKYHVAVLTDQSVSYAQSLFLEGIANASEKNDMVFEHYYVTEENLQSQFELVMLTKVDGVVLRLSDHALIGGHIKTLREQGIFVVLIGNDAPETERNVYLGSNKYQQGKDAALLALEAMETEGDIILIAGSEYSGKQSVSLKHLTSGIYDALYNYPHNHLSGIFYSKEVRAELIVDDLLNQEHSIKAIICTDPIDVARVIRVLVDRNAVGEIKIISNGITTEIEEFLEKNIIYASIVEDHYSIGELAIEHMKSLLMSEWGSSYVNVPFQVVK